MQDELKGRLPASVDDILKIPCLQQNLSAEEVQSWTTTCRNLGYVALIDQALVVPSA